MKLQVKILYIPPIWGYWRHQRGQTSAKYFKQCQKWDLWIFRFLWKLLEILVVFLKWDKSGIVIYHEKSNNLFYTFCSFCHVTHTPRSLGWRRTLNWRWGSLGHVEEFGIKDPIWDSLGFDEGKFDMVECPTNHYTIQP